MAATEQLKLDEDRPEKTSLMQMQGDAAAVKVASIGEKDKANKASLPLDTWNLVYLVLLIHGIGTLMPWNMFINANEYFVNYKLSDNYTGNHADVKIYRDYFLNFLGFVAQIPNVLLNGANMFCQCGSGGTANLAFRIIWSIVIVVAMFILTILLALMDSSIWPGEFFWITMIIVVIINMANGIYQNSIYGTAALFPMKYTSVVVLGSNISGTITAVLNIIAIAASPNPRSAAVFYFLMAVVILLFAFDSYYYLPKLNFFRYHDVQQMESTKTDSKKKEFQMPPYWTIFKQCWVQLMSVFLVFVVTLSCFPAITAGVKAYNPEFFIEDKYFSAVTCFLLFNLFAMLGSLLSTWVHVPGPRWIWLPVVLRLIFIPFFLFCNAFPTKRALPVLVRNDYVYCLGMIIFALSSGYCSSLAMMYSPTKVKDKQYQGIAGMMAAFFLIFGIFIGVLFSFPLTAIILNVGSHDTFNSTLDAVSTMDGISYSASTVHSVMLMTDITMRP